MNRLADLKGTLATNLKENECHSNEVEFVVACLSRSDGTANWLETTFPQEIEREYLRVIEIGEPGTWHFGRAKNAFQSHMVGKIYSSLDGDNFVTADETRLLKEVHAEIGRFFIVHHFAGQWGDGTCGRISMPLELYCTVGYDERFLPRQFDEIDLIVTALHRYPAVPFVTCHGDADIFQKSKYATQFIDDGLVHSKTLRIRQPIRLPPLNRREATYASEGTKLNAMTRFNFCLSRLKNSGSDDPMAGLEKNFLRARLELVDSSRPIDLEDMLLEDRTQRTRPHSHSSSISLFMCSKNDERFLPSFLDHYRELGVDTFYIVDDNSDTPLERAVRANDVHIFRPKVGSFLSSKALWLTALIRSRSPNFGWNITVDSDEFIEAPNSFRDLPSLVSWCNERDFCYLPGLLLEMLPRGSDSIDEYGLNAFDRVASVSQPPTVNYANHPSVKWGFGERASMSWKVDARYHAFGTFNSLRKVPLFQHRGAWQLNQGFHTLHKSSREGLGTNIWTDRPLLPVRHLKIEKILSLPGVFADPSIRSAYHHRTASNMKTVSALSEKEIFARLSAVPSVPFEEWQREKLET